MVFNWNDEKNQELKKSRNISFEEIVVAIENGNILDVLENPSARYRNQVIIIVEYENYAYAVPTMKRDEEFFLKTIFPSRKYTSLYLRNED